MKLLVIGFDGADAENFSYLPMPFINNLLESSVQPKLTEDLLSRGWAEIVSGAHGMDTGAFYYRPKALGEHVFTQSFRKDDFRQSLAARPLWDLLTEKGVRAGFMNIPTTFPAPKVDGFFVSGAGAGLKESGAGKIPAGAAYPADLEKLLEDNSYIFDVRLIASGIKDLDEFMDLQIEMTKRRTSSFLAACKKYTPEFSFLTYMMTRSIFNAFKSELEALNIQKGVAKTNTQQRLLEAMKLLDDCVKEIFQSLQPQHHILVSDHGTVPYLNRIDPNVFLRNAGFQPYDNSVQAKTTKVLKNIIKSIVPVELRSKLRRRLSAEQQLRMENLDINLANAKAFSARYVPGIYINDERFSGPVSAKDRSILTTKICDVFNSQESTIEYGLKALPYRQNYPSAEKNWMLPDIWIEHPDTIFFEHGIGQSIPSNGALIQSNEDYGPVPTLQHVKRDLWTGLKGRNPLFAVDEVTASLLKSSDPNDLRVVHRIIERTFS